MELKEVNKDMMVFKKAEIIDNDLVDVVHFLYNPEDESKKCYVIVWFKENTFIQKLKLAYRLIFKDFNNVEFTLTNEHQSTIQSVATHLKNKKGKKR